MPKDLGKKRERGDSDESFLKRHKGQVEYGLRQKALGNAYQEYKKSGGSLSWLKFLASDEAKEVRRTYGRGYNNKSAGSDNSEGAITPDRNMANLPHDNDSIDSPMDFENLSLQDNDNSGRQLSSNSRGRGGMTDAFVKLPKSKSAEDWTMSFHKSRIMFSYAYANTQLEDKTLMPSVDVFTTSLCYVPVDFLPFYLSPSEYQNLPNFCKIIDVWCKIKIIGVRSAFDTGTTLSGTATAEYCPILMTCIGLNNETDIYNFKYNTEATKPMIPNGINQLKVKDIMSKYYGGVHSSVQCVPRSASYYACQYWNKEKYEPAEDNKEPHLGKTNRMDNIIDQYLLNSTIGETVINYNYTPKMGYIKNLKQSYIPFGRMGEIKTTVQGTIKRKILWSSASKKKILSSDGWEEHYTSGTFHYGQNLELYNAFHIRGNVPLVEKVQPQVHIGMQAIPQLNPSTESTDFLNAALYFHIECGCVVKGSNRSVWTHGVSACHPKDQIIMNYDKKSYMQPTEVFGRHDKSSEIDALEEEHNYSNKNNRFARFYNK